LNSRKVGEWIKRRTGRELKNKKQRGIPIISYGTNISSTRNFTVIANPAVSHVGSSAGDRAASEIHILVHQLLHQAGENPASWL
jgi:hypothetical protein